MHKNNWTREETIIAFNVYCKIPFKRSSKFNPTVIKYAELIDRTPSALNMKIGNIGRLDPELKKQGIVGLKHGSKLEEEVWEEFNGDWESLAFESEALIAKLSDKSIEEVVEIEDIKEGVDKEVLVKQRVNQNFFRSTILSSYYFKCCITGLSIPEFLVSSHIVPWSKNKENRLNPRNGLCLNSLHDKAFDRGFLTITPDYVVKLSSSFGDYLESYSVQEYFVKYQDQKIMLPDKFLPKKDFLDYHNQNIFKG
jgi:putative restriction endonuclease